MGGNSCKRGTGRKEEKEGGREGMREEEGKISLSSLGKINQGSFCILRFKKETGNKGNKCLLNIYHVPDTLLNCWDF